LVAIFELIGVKASEIHQQLRPAAVGCFERP
jgi:hypothetical protein